ncbi:hypothetical protein [Nannocystis punicea]|uniref:Uncharacterized protein n=1 Tax=Nannocystis punicea TaxID=2995304 RepID=A0ABY7HBS3_9BACT|nr:hypothetical protein [Nannocystis poenicansa]WAS96717.1 hypothetical protein O0S08_11250 [Nannocystis poenicansa]
MSSGPLEHAERRRAQIEEVRALRAGLAALIAGRTTREELSRWLRELWPPGSGQGGPFLWQPAACVYDSLLSLNRRWGEQELVREVELRAYLRWLGEGECCFTDDGDSLFVLHRDIDELAAWAGVEAVRWWHSGLGWWTSLQFGSPASRRVFVVHSALERPDVVGFHPQRGVAREEAIRELFEVLAIDDADVTRVDPQIDLERLPRWALIRQDDNGNRFEIARFRSYTKAYAQERTLTARGHKQLYWVEPA